MPDSKGHVQGSQLEMHSLGPAQRGTGKGAACILRGIFYKARDVETMNQIPSTPQIKAAAPGYRLEIQ